MHCELDHIVVVATNLRSGVEFVQQTIGMEPQPGGAHPSMGTHNCLLRLGDRIYLEVIAIDPDAARPDRLRWFGLDNLTPDSRPRFAAWVARTNDIEQTAKVAPELGKVTPMSRGAMKWRITIRDDGTPPLEGIAPSIIQWPDGVHPTNRMPDSGCSLDGIEGFHRDPDKVAAVLDAIAFAGPYHVARAPATVAARLVANIRTPAGLRRLSTSSS